MFVGIVTGRVPGDELPCTWNDRQHAATAIEKCYIAQQMRSFPTCEAGSCLFAPAINVYDDGIGSPYYHITAMYTCGTEHQIRKHQPAASTQPSTFLEFDIKTTN